MNIGWPQGIWIGMAVIGLILAAALDGEPKTGTHKFSVNLCGAMIAFGLLYWGGFFG